MTPGHVFCIKPLKMLTRAGKCDELLCTLTRYREIGVCYTGDVWSLKASGEDLIRTEIRYRTQRRTS